MEYVILQASLVAGLWEAVGVYIAEGWCPCGGVAYGKQKWVQAMTRDPMRKLFHDKATVVVNNTSLVGGNGATEKP